MKKREVMSLPFNSNLESTSIFSRCPTEIASLLFSLPNNISFSLYFYPSYFFPLYFIPYPNKALVFYLAKRGKCTKNDPIASRVTYTPLL